MEKTQYTAPSPYDDQQTQQIETRPPLQTLDTASANTLSHPPTRHIENKPSLRVEAFFDPRNPEAFPQYDTSLVEREQLWTQLHDQTFTQEELVELNNNSQNPHLEALMLARAELDSKTRSRWERFNMDGPVRRKLKKERQTAQDIFDSARRAYIESQLPPVETVTPLAVLTAARATLAEATYDARQGTIGGNKKAHDAYSAAEQTYVAARDLYFDELSLEHAQTFTPEEKIQFATTLKDRERGALAGEEANHYLTQVNDEDKKSLFTKLTERYNKLSRPQKIGTGIAVAALAGIGFGAIGGATAVGGIIGARFGRNYLTGEASRLKDSTNERSQQETSILYASSESISRDERQFLTEQLENRNELFNSLQEVHADYHEAAVTRESRRISKEKRKVLGKAALFTAIPFASGALGMLAEHGFPALSHGLFRERGLFGFHMSDSSDTQPGTPAQASDAPPAIDEQPGASDPAPQPEVQPQPEAPLVSPRQNYLYDIYAGKALDLTIPAGSHLWGEVGNTLAQQQPTLPFAERERLTGNIVQEILRQNPTIDPESIPVNSRISVNIAA